MSSTNEELAAAPSTPSLLDRLGGKEALTAVVEAFYFRILCDDDLLGFFDGVNTSLLKVHQHKFLAMAFSAHSLDIDAVSESIAESHRRLWATGLSEVHFDLVAAHLVDTLLEMGVAQPLIDEVVAIVGPLRAVFKENAKLVTTFQKEQEVTSTILDPPKKKKDSIFRRTLFKLIPKKSSRECVTWGIFTV